MNDKYEYSSARWKRQTLIIKIKGVSSLSKKKNNCNKSEECKGDYGYPWKIIFWRRVQLRVSIHTSKIERKGSTTLMLLCGKPGIHTSMYPLLKFQFIYCTWRHGRLSRSVNCNRIYCERLYGSLKSLKARGRIPAAEMSISSDGMLDNDGCKLCCSSSSKQQSSCEMLHKVNADEIIQIKNRCSGRS